jgi:hypothetical protein
MTIDEAIKHCEDVARNNDITKQRCDDASGYTRSGREDIRTSEAKKCEQCAADHRQLAEWLRDYKTLLEQKLTDQEQRIFLAAMSKEEKVCRVVDGEYKGGDALLPVCASVERKVKRALFE